MIAKGTPHTNGARLARYMVTGKDGERAELHELRGFAESDIVDAFRSEHIVAQATHCEQPFFHCQVRNPVGEHLTRQQWEQVASRIESKLGLTDQPRAIAFHIKDDHEHMHIAWSRIDHETMKAKPLPFYKLRLKEVCRQLEPELGLSMVRNERRPEEPRAPSRAERDQAQRLGVDVEAVRASIRASWAHSDSGRAFVTALSERGLSLARGDKRDFIVVDQAGGLHALGKRVLGVTASTTRARLSDLEWAALLTVEATRESLAKDEREPQVSKEAGLEEEWQRAGRATCSDDAGLVAQQMEANRRHLELNPSLRSDPNRGSAIPERRPELEGQKAEPVDHAASAELEKQHRIAERARQLEEQWQQARDLDLGRDR
jgi:hypothetical protein